MTRSLACLLGYHTTNIPWQIPGTLYIGPCSRCREEMTERIPDVEFLAGRPGVALKVVVAGVAGVAFAGLLAWVTLGMLMGGGL